MNGKILKIIIFSFIFGANLAFSDAAKVSMNHVDHRQDPFLHGWCQHRSQHLSTDNEYLETLLRHADMVMYVDKQSVRNRFYHYDSELDTRAHNHRETPRNIHFE